MSLLKSPPTAYLLARKPKPQPEGVSAMLKELNAIAGGLLGLQGYPVEPISWADMFHPNAKPSADAGVKRPVAAPAAQVPGTLSGTPALHC
jgi:hypothetical protein